MDWLNGKHVFISRNENNGFDGVVTQVRDKWIYITVTDNDSAGFDGIWINTDQQREIGILK